MLKVIESKKYLQIALDLKKNYKFFDLHVHPYEIFREANNTFQNVKKIYKDNCETEKKGKQIIEDLIFDEEGKYNKISNIFMKNDALAQKFAKLYDYASPNLFKLYMDMSLIDKILFLPVALPIVKLNRQITQMNRLFGKDERFYLGSGIPSNLSNSGVYSYLREKKYKYDIKAVKVHPNVSEIDLFTKNGIERIECILYACDKLKLPLIIHGGRSPSILLKNKKAAKYSIIENLEQIDWGISNYPVIIAHACSYGYEKYEMEKTVLPRVQNLILKFKKLFVDISGLNIEQIGKVLENLEIDRIVFGSDALYDSQWAGIVKLLYCLKENDLEESFLKIVSFNPSKIMNAV